MSIYVATLIHADIDTVWRYTQDPAFVVRWDLRLSSLRYLPRTSRSASQRFVFSTPFGFEGEGELVGVCSEVDGTRTTKLRFTCSRCAGWAVWQYVPTEDGVRLQTRFGLEGRLLDALLARPLLGWATAWSFDRLRLWLEAGIEPEMALRKLLPRAGRCVRRI